jgi:chromosome segregation ATPase
MSVPNYADLLADIAALRAPIEELTRERDRQRSAAEKHYAVAEDRLVQLERAERRAEQAEARLAKVVHELERIRAHAKDHSTGDHGGCSAWTESVAAAALAAARGEEGK